MIPGMRFGRIILPPAFFFALANALPALMQLLLMPVYGWKMDMAEFGCLTLVQAVILLFQLFCGAPLAAAINRYWAEGSGLVVKSSAHFMTALFALAGTAILVWTPHPFLVTALPIQPDALVYALLISSLTAWEAQYLAARIQKKQASSFLVFMALHAGFSLGGTLIVLLGNQPDHADVLLGRLCGMAIPIIPLTIISWKEAAPSVAILKQIIRFTLPMFPYLLLSQALLFLDRWTTGLLMDESHAGMIGLAIALVSVNEMAFQAIRNQVQPDIYQAWSGRDSGLYHSSCATYLRLGLGVYCLSFPVSFLALYALLPASYHPALAILPLIQAAYWFRFRFILDSLAEFYAPRAGSLSTAAAAGLGAALLCGWWLIPAEGLFGAALAFGVSRAVVALITRWFEFRRPDFFSFSYPLWSWIPFVFFLLLGVGFRFFF